MSYKASVTKQVFTPQLFHSKGQSHDLALCVDLHACHDGNVWQHKTQVLSKNLVQPSYSRLSLSHRRASSVNRRDYTTRLEICKQENNCPFSRLLCFAY